MVNYVVSKTLDNGVEMMSPLDNGKGAGGARDKKVESGKPIYFDPFNKIVDNDPREFFDLELWFEDMVRDNEYFIDDDSNPAFLGGSFGNLIEFAKELKVAVRRSIESCRKELTFLGEDEDGDGMKMVRWHEKALGGIDDLIETRKSGIIDFEDMMPEGLRAEANEFRRLWLIDAVVGGVLRRYTQFVKFEKIYAEYVLREYSGKEGWKEWREKKWGTVHASLYRSLKVGE